MIKKVYIEEDRGFDNRFIEFTEILTTIQLFRHAMVNTMQVMTQNDL